MDTLRTRLLRIAVTLVACVGVAEAALVLVRPAEMLEHWRQLTGAALESSSTSVYRFEASAPGMLEVYLSAGLSVLSLSLATLLAWRAAHRPEARVLSVFLASLFVPGVLLSWAGVSIQAQGVIHAGLTWVAGACFLRFATLFPHPVTPALLLRAREIRAERGGKRVRAPGRATLALLRPGVLWGAAAAGATLSIAAQAMGWTPLLSLILIPVLWGMARGVGFLRASYAVAQAAGRRRILWVVQGFYLALWAVGLGVAASMVISMRAGFLQGAARAEVLVIPYSAMASYLLSTIVAMAVIIICLGFSVLYDGALDPALALRRTTIYGVLTVTGALLFAVVENVASSLLASVLGLSEGMGAAVAGAVVALAFGPLRDRITRLVGQRVSAGPEPEEIQGELARA